MGDNSNKHLEVFLEVNSNKHLEVFLEVNSNKQRQEEVYLDQVVNQFQAHRATHNTDSLDSLRTDKILVQALTKHNKCRHSK